MGSEMCIRDSKDAVYINVPGSFSKKDAPAGEGEKMMLELQDAQTTLDTRAAQGDVRLFEGDDAIDDRSRRRAFDDSVGDDEDGDEDDEDDGDIEIDAPRGVPLDDDADDANEDIAYAESDSDMGDDTDGRFEGDDDAAPWKNDLAARAEATVRDNLSRRKPDLMRLVYGTDARPEDIGTRASDGITNADFFVVHTESAKDAPVPEEARPAVPAETLEAWDDEDKLDSIRHLFITGDTDDVAEGAPKDDDADDDDEEDEEAKDESLAAKKAALKRKFDEQYDGSEEENEDDWYTCLLYTSDAADE